MCSSLGVDERHEQYRRNGPSGCVKVASVPLTQQILEAASGLQEGEVLLPKELLHLATRAAVDQALSRLTREGKLMRIGRGAYSRRAPLVDGGCLGECAWLSASSKVVLPDAAIIRPQQR